MQQTPVRGTAFSSFPRNVFCPVVIYIFNILSLLCLVAGLCHQLTNALVERKQVRMLFEYL